MTVEEFTVEEFRDLIVEVTGGIAGRPLDGALEAHLNAAFPAGGDTFETIRRACEAAVAAGWMCNRGEAPRRYGRVIKPGPATHGFSVDVVDIDDAEGPHHRHPTGEIDMIMPVAGDARFDGRGAGWLVYGPGTAHVPTVSGGEALVLYLLPEGAIEFTKT